MTSNLFQQVVTPLNQQIFGGCNQQQYGFNPDLQGCIIQSLRLFTIYLTLILPIATFKTLSVSHTSNTGNAMTQSLDRDLVIFEWILLESAGNQTRKS